MDEKTATRDANYESRPQLSNKNGASEFEAAPFHPQQAAALEPNPHPTVAVNLNRVKRQAVQGAT